MGNIAKNVSLEISPAQQEKIPRIVEKFAKATKIFITHIADAPFAPILTCATRLIDSGLTPVVHMPARAFINKRQLEEWLCACSKAGIRNFLAIGGDLATTRGDFPTALSMLETGLFGQYQAQTIFIAGHPEGNRTISKEILQNALQEKIALLQAQNIAVAITTQFCFCPQTVLAWRQEIQPFAKDIPIHIGLAGPARLSQLLKYAALCGIGPSIRFLRHKPGKISSLLASQTPDAMIDALADAPWPIVGIHLFPFGQIEQTADWWAKRMEQNPARMSLQRAL